MKTFASIVAFGALATSVFSQSGQWADVPRTVLSLPPGASADISIPAGYLHWIVGAKVIPGTADRLDVMDADFPVRHGLRPAPNAHPGPISAHPGSLLSVAGTKIAISGAGDTLLGYLTLASPRTVNIIGPSGAPISVPVGTDGVTIADGTVKNAAPNGEGMVIAMALTVGLGQGPPAIISTAAGNTVTDAGLLRSHLARYVAFQNVSPGQAATAFVSLLIGADGAVQSASCPNSLPPATAAACASAAASILQWAFQPFSMNGQPSLVSARLRLDIGTDGGIASSISPEVQSVR